MSTHTIDRPAQPNARQLTNRAMLRMVVVATLSIVFALINCTSPVDQGQGITSPAPELPTVAQAAAAVPAQSPDHPLRSEAHARPN